MIIVLIVSSDASTAKRLRRLGHRGRSWSCPVEVIKIARELRSTALCCTYRCTYLEAIRPRGSFDATFDDHIKRPHAVHVPRTVHVGHAARPNRNKSSRYSKNKSQYCILLRIPKSRAHRATRQIKNSRLALPELDALRR